MWRAAAEISHLVPGSKSTRSASEPMAMHPFRGYKPKIRAGAAEVISTIRSIPIRPSRTAISWSRESRVSIPGQAVREIAEWDPRAILLCPPKGTMVRGHDIDLAPGERIEKRLPIRGLPERRSNQELRALRPGIPGIVQREVLRTGLHVDGRPDSIVPRVRLRMRPFGPLSSRPPTRRANRGHSTGRRNVNEVDSGSNPAGDLADLLNRSRLSLRRSRQGIVGRAGPACGCEPFLGRGHETVVLGMDENLKALLPRDFQDRSQLRRVDRHPFLRVGREDLEACGPQLRQSIEFPAKPGLESTREVGRVDVQGIVAAGLAVEIAEPIPQALDQALSWALTGEVDHRRDPAEEGRRGPGRGIVARARALHREAEVDMRIDQARQDEKPRGIDPAPRRGIDPGGDLRDPLLADAEVADPRAVRAHHPSAGDHHIVHR